MGSRGGERCDFGAKERMAEWVGSERGVKAARVGPYGCVVARTAGREHWGQRGTELTHRAFCSEAPESGITFLYNDRVNHSNII